jgi:hypothetical protein
MSLTPPLFVSGKPDGPDVTKLRPSDWNAVSNLLTRVLGGAEPDGYYLIKDSASNDGVSWSSEGGGDGDGSVQAILDGAGVPTVGTGNIGDFYLDTQTGTLYGPKVAGAPPGPQQFVNYTPPFIGGSPGSIYTMGMKYRFTVPGELLGVRFFINTPMGPVSSYRVQIWSSTGTLLAAIAASSLVAGFNTVMFPASVPVFAATTYLASWSVPGTGTFAYQSGPFTGITTGDVRALADGEDGQQGLYAFGADSFPTVYWAGNSTPVSPIFRTTGVEPWPVAIDGRVASVVFDGVTPPTPVAGKAMIYVDQADGQLKVMFGDGEVAILSGGGAGIPDPLTVGTVQGGSGATSKLTLKSTSGAGDATSVVDIRAGTDGSLLAARFRADGIKIEDDRWIWGTVATYPEGTGPDRRFLRWAGTGYAPMNYGDHAEIGCGPDMPVTGQDGGYLWFHRASCLQQIEVGCHASRPMDGINFGGDGVRGSLWMQTDGVLTLSNSNRTTFDRVQFGGQTSSFPALKRSSAELQVKLADDSAFADFRCRNIAFGVNNVYMTGRNAAGTADINILKVNASNEVDVGVKMNTGLLTCDGLTLVGSSGISGSLTGTIAAGANGWLGIGTRAYFNSPSTGVLTVYDGAATSFDRLQFGGTSASFPALKRSNTILQARLANDSDYAPLECGTLTTSSTVVVGAGTDSAPMYIGFNNRTIIRAPVAGCLRISNWAESGFDRLQFGGVTASAPAIKRNGATLETRLADDSALAGHTVGTLTVGTSAAQTGLIRLPLTTGINFRNPAGTGDHNLICTNSFGDVQIGQGGWVVYSMGTFYSAMVNIQSQLDMAGTSSSIRFQERTGAPPTPPADRMAMWCEDNGAGKTRLMVQFNTGAAIQIAIEP